MTGPEIAVALPCPRWSEALPAAEELARRVAAATLATLAGDDALGDLPADRLEVSLVLSDDAEVQSLNRQYRGQDKTTNVLSFAALDDAEAPLPEDGPVLLGDIILAFETTQAEAAAEGKSLADHLSHLIVHGLLHLLGYDHDDAEDAEEMEELERAVLAGLGIADPYDEPDDAETDDAPPADAPKERDDRQ